jgi:hypothetical protein
LKVEETLNGIVCGEVENYGENHHPAGDFLFLFYTTYTSIWRSTSNNMCFVPSNVIVDLATEDDENGVKM